MHAHLLMSKYLYVLTKHTTSKLTENNAGYKMSNFVETISKFISDSLIPIILNIFH